MYKHLTKSASSYKPFTINLSKDETVYGKIVPNSYNYIPEYAYALKIRILTVSSLAIKSGNNKN